MGVATTWSLASGRPATGLALQALDHRPCISRDQLGIGRIALVSCGPSEVLRHRRSSARRSIRSRYALTSSAVASPMRRTRSGSCAAPRPILCGKMVALGRLLWPWTASTPNRIGIAMPLAAGFEDAARKLVDQPMPVGGARRVRCRRVRYSRRRGSIRADRSARSSGVIVLMSAWTNWPTFCSTVIRAISVGDALLGRRVGDRRRAVRGGPRDGMRDGAGRRRGFAPTALQPSNAANSSADRVPIIILPSPVCERYQKIEFARRAPRKQGSVQPLQREQRRRRSGREDRENHEQAGESPASARSDRQPRHDQRRHGVGEVEQPRSRPRCAGLGNTRNVCPL